MVDRQTILNELPAFKNKYARINDNQNVEDIIRAIKNCHKDFASDYDKICKYFIGSTPYKTCRNIFDFLRNNIEYFIESEEEQTVKSPAAILHTGNIDCKGNSLFACGVLDAINRTGMQEIPYCYRFVSDSLFNITPNHVFCVAFPNTDSEIYIDPIPQVESFNQPINYYYSQDKKFKAMSLYKVSGIENRIGFTIPVIGVDTNDIGQVVNIVTKLFPGHSNWWIMDNAYRTGDFNTAANMMAAFYSDASYNTHPEQGAGFNGDLAVRERQSWIPVIYEKTHSPVILNILKDAVSKGLLPANTLPNMGVSNYFSNSSSAGAGDPVLPIRTDYASGATYDANNTRVYLQPSGVYSFSPTGNTKAGMNILLTLGLVGAAIFFLTKKKR